MEEPGSYSPWGHKGSDMTERLHFTFLLVTDRGINRRTGLRQSPQGLSEQRRTGRWEIKERGSGGWRAVTRVDVLSARWTEDFRKTTTV